MLTTEQIIALAPDASSAKNGRGLANAAKWHSLGKTEFALWGECQGSGKNPYQTAIDLREPAFKCSCPSRKFPCKHGLGLFLLFAAQDALFNVAAPPQFCAEWLEKRDAQKSKKETKDDAELTADEIAKRAKSKEKRLVEREKKVAEGLRELELWLRDLVRQGLATARNQSSNYWEKIAKRMVDAQANGAARLISDLSSAISQSDDWAEDFLAQAGKIYLLIEAYKNLENLSEAIQSDVKTAVGWTIKEDELENAETIADKWFVCGQRVYEEEKLRVQRTWLTGENSERNALILDFAFQNQPLDVSLVVGTKIEAEIAFYPGNYPLRASVKKRGDSLESFTDLNGCKNFDELAENFSEAVSRNLWIEVFPAALEKVVPVVRDEKCFLRDGRAKLLPLAFDAESWWHLLAFSGGAEISVFGEWNGENSFSSAGVGERQNDRFMNLAEELKTTAIVGTAQKALDLSGADGKLGATLAKIDGDDKEKTLLAVAAVCGAWQSAGKVLPTDKENLPEIAEAETLETLAGNLKHLYETQLNSADKSLLPEFLELMKRHGKTIPPELLPLTFALGNTHLQFRGTDFRRQILPVIGNRGKWLARQNPRWNWVLFEEAGAEMFETGKADERLFALESLRRADANKARETLQANWKSEAAKDRQKFVEVLRVNLSAADEEFLNEIAQTDKSAEVRQTAFDLLASLPDSRLVKDLTAQIWEILRFVKGGILRSAKIEINFPSDFDKNEFAYFQFSKTKSDLGRKGWKFAQILGAVSLSEIEKRFSVKPLEFIAAVKNSPWTLEIFLGLSAAARRQENYDWFEALLFGFGEKENAVAFEGKYQSRNDFTENLRQSIAALPSEKVETAANLFLTKNELLNDEHPAFYFLQNYEGKWSGELSENFLRAIRSTFSTKTKRKKDERIWSVLEFLPSAAALMPFRFGARNVFEADENYQPEALKKLREFEEILKLRFQINAAFEREENNL